MLRIILIYGLIAGLIVAVPMNLMIALVEDPETMMNSQFAGFLLMFVALSLIFVGVKTYRDRAKGGVISFVSAFLIGLGISGVAALMYIVGREINLALTDYAFMPVYTEHLIEAERAKGVAGAELDAFIAEMRQMEANYTNPLFRVPVTFIEIFPVGLIISLISAALLRNSRFLPARPSPAA